MRCARKPTSVKQPKWHSLSKSSTACWRWDARATSASYETTRTRDHCVHRLIHATRSFGGAYCGNNRCRRRSRGGSSQSHGSHEKTPVGGTGVLGVDDRAGGIAIDRL